MPPQLPRSCLTSTPHFNESASETQSVSEFEFRKVEKAKAPGYRQLGPLVEQLSPFNPNTERIVPSKTRERFALFHTTTRFSDDR